MAGLISNNTYVLYTPGSDETVLWEGNASTATLNESLLNYESIKLWVTTNIYPQYKFSVEQILDPTYSSQFFNLSYVIYHTVSANPFQEVFARANVSSDYKTITCVKGWRRWGSDITTIKGGGEDTDFYILKVIGINRKAQQ